MLHIKEPHYLNDIQQKAFIKFVCLWRPADLDWAHLGQLAGATVFHMFLFLLLRQRVTPDMFFL